MTPEAELSADLIEQADRSARGLDDAVRVLGVFPDNRASFEAMSAMQQLISTAMPKQVEQLEGSLHGAFRVSLRILGISLKGLYSLDIGNRMAELGVIEDGKDWLAAVKLRNELVHEYSDKASARFTRAARAFAMAPLLRDALARLKIVVAERGWLNDKGPAR